jgi:hypothetical protein
MFLSLCYTPRRISLIERVKKENFKIICFYLFLFFYDVATNVRRFVNMRKIMISMNSIYLKSFEEKKNHLFCSRQVKIRHILVILNY